MSSGVFICSLSLLLIRIRLNEDRTFQEAIGPGCMRFDWASVTSLGRGSLSRRGIRLLLFTEWMTPTILQLHSRAPGP